MESLELWCDFSVANGAFVSVEARATEGSLGRKEVGIKEMAIHGDAGVG